MVGDFAGRNWRQRFCLPTKNPSARDIFVVIAKAGKSCIDFIVCHCERRPLAAYLRIELILRSVTEGGRCADDLRRHLVGEADQIKGMDPVNRLTVFGRERDQIECAVGAINDWSRCDADFRGIVATLYHAAATSRDGRSKRSLLEDGPSRGVDRVDRIVLGDYIGDLVQLARYTQIRNDKRLSIDLFIKNDGFQQAERAGPNRIRREPSLLRIPSGSHAVIMISCDLESLRCLCDSGQMSEGKADRRNTDYA